MKVKAVTYQFEGRVSLYLVPETEVERSLLQSIWRFGKLELTNGVADRTGEGFAISQSRLEGEVNDKCFAHELE